MKLWEKKGTGKLHKEGYLFYLASYPRYSFPRGGKFTCIKIRDMFEEGIPNLTLGGFRI